MLRDSTILYVFENNLGKEHDHLTALIARTPGINNTKVLYENNQVVGFHSFAHTKLAADDELRAYVTRDALRFADRVMTMSNETTNPEGAIVEKLVHQIEEMREYVRQKPNGTYARVVTSIHGQDLKRVRGNKDDLQRALSMLLMVHRMFAARLLDLNYAEIYAMRAKRRNIREEISFVANKRIRLSRDDGEDANRESMMYTVGNG